MSTGISFIDEKRMKLYVAFTLILLIHCCFDCLSFPESRGNQNSNIDTNVYEVMNNTTLNLGDNVSIAIKKINDSLDKIIDVDVKPTTTNVEEPSDKKTINDHVDVNKNEDDVIQKFINDKQNTIDNDELKPNNNVVTQKNTQTSEIVTQKPINDEQKVTANDGNDDKLKSNNVVTQKSTHSDDDILETVSQKFNNEKTVTDALVVHENNDDVKRKPVDVNNNNNKLDNKEIRKEIHQENQTRLDSSGRNKNFSVTLNDIQNHFDTTVDYLTPVIYSALLTLKAIVLLLIYKFRDPINRRCSCSNRRRNKNLYENVKYTSKTYDTQL